MNCTTRMSTLKPPLTTIFGSLFILTSVMAIVGNGFALIIIWKPGRKITSPTKLLTSLAVSDLLVGIILSPLTCWQVLDYISLKVCEIDYARRYFYFFLCVTSGLTLALISYDRYILLTKLTNYNKYMSKRKLIILLTLAWLVPALIPVFQIKIFGPYIYFLGIVICFFGVLIVLIISYCCIVRVIRKKEKKVLTRVKELQLVENNTDTANCEKGKEPSNLTKNKHVNEKDMSKKVEQREKKYVALAKSVVILILFFLLLNVPVSLWTILSLINVKYDFVNKNFMDICYVTASLTAQFNSCVNPFIYFFKNPEFRRRAKNCFKSQENKSIKCQFRNL